ncbi:unnamed protein product [Trichogramma brassicae]|uniref:Uncharacterized protein n=1 Tax=Trichogramma brassicae TaxID=86971 RepID=A0A6H5IZL5_9HYME|nr:unnamed protein product [Trichogramma brassicae]
MERQHRGVSEELPSGCVDALSELAAVRDETICREEFADARRRLHRAIKARQTPLLEAALRRG